MTGYIAVDHTRSLTVLAFRGSKSIPNFIADADFPAVPTDICPDCTVDQGFYNSWLEARTGVLAVLKSTAAANPSYKVVVVGHSLGGAIAAIAAAELRNAGTSTDLYTYGQPRIGGPMVSNYITNQNQGGNFRVTHYDDPVPRLPPLVLGFVHISPEYYIKSGNGVAVTAGDVTELTGSVNIMGNTGNFGNGVDLAVSHLSQSLSLPETTQTLGCRAGRRSIGLPNLFIWLPSISRTDLLTPMFRRRTDGTSTR